MNEEEYYRYLEKGDLIQAKKWLRNMEGKVPKTRILYLQGVLLERTGDYQEALKRYDMALVMHLSDPSIWLAKARALSHLGRLDLAKRAAERAIKLSPGSANAHVVYGNILLKMKSYDPALKEARTAVEIDMESTGALILHGLLLSLKDQDFRQALAQFDRAIGVDETCIEAWTNRGIVLRQLGDREGAIYSFQRALRLRPTDPTATNMLASMGLREKGRVIDLDKEAPANAGAAQKDETPEYDEFDEMPEVPREDGSGKEGVTEDGPGMGWGDVTDGSSGPGKKETIELKCPRCGTFFLVKTGTRFSCPSCKLQGEVD
jgi:tetratricopeptide (TPR) repeat protein